MSNERKMSKVSATYDSGLSAHLSLHNSEYYSQILLFDYLYKCKFRFHLIQKLNLQFKSVFLPNFF